MVLRSPVPATGAGSVPATGAGSAAAAGALDRRIAVGLAIVLVLAAFGLRLVEIQRTTYVPLGDATSYLTLGAQITQHGDYADTGHAAGGTKGPTAYFAPGYPYLIAAVDELTGHTGAAATGAVHAQRIAQAVIGTLIVALIGLIAYEIFDLWVALVALGMAAIYPVFVALSAVLVAENMLTMFELLATWCVLRALRDNGRLRWVVLGGHLGRPRDARAHQRLPAAAPARRRRRPSARASAARAASSAPPRSR